MIGGALAISLAEAPASERACWRRAMERECARYDLPLVSQDAAPDGEPTCAGPRPRRRWWEMLIIALATGIFAWLGLHATSQRIEVNVGWMVVLAALSLLFLAVCGTALWRRTRFS